MSVAITRLSDNFTRHIPMQDTDIVHITRSFVQDERNDHKYDKYVTRGTHAILLRQSHRLWLFNQHENEIYVLGPQPQAVPLGHWAHVSGRVIDMCCYTSGRLNVLELQFHIELSDLEAPEFLPPTPVL